MSNDNKPTTEQQTPSSGVAPKVFGSQTPTVREPTEATQLNALKQADGAIHTGASNSTSSFKVDPAMQALVIPETEAGYYSMQAGSLRGKDGKVVKGISTDRGFFYPDNLPKEAKEVLKSLVARGLAYAHKPSTK